MKEVLIICIWSLLMIVLGAFIEKSIRTLDAQYFTDTPTALERLVVKDAESCYQMWSFYKRIGVK